MLTLGLQLAVSVVAFVFLGVWLDSIFDTKPVLTVIGAVVGVTGSLIRFIKTAIDLGKQSDRNMAERRKHQEQ
ncbi:MAG: AtpZ/AtpI family protein [Ignavibacteria bacterium]|nr:AtpZ/AtpI family protein [Ignavibacteria bacterium]